METGVISKAKGHSTNGGHAVRGTSSPSPRLPSGRLRPSATGYGEGRGEGAFPRAQTRGEAPSPAPTLPSPARGGGEGGGDLFPQVGRGEGCSPTLYRLMTWMSPAYPVGAFSYSGGLEWAVEAGDVHNADTLRGWLTTIIRHGSVFCDAAMFCHAHRAAANGDDQALAATAELAAAFIGSKERFLETTAQGQAFLQITQSAWATPALDRLVAAWDGPLAYPVVVASACAGHGITLIPALHAFLHGVISNLVSAGG